MPKIEADELLGWVDEQDKKAQELSDNSPSDHFAVGYLIACEHFTSKIKSMIGEVTEQDKITDSEGGQ